MKPEIIRELVERIEVFKPEKTPGSRTKKQTVIIYWNIIGAVNSPRAAKKNGIAGILHSMPFFFSMIKIPL